MIKWIETTGRTEEDAISAALFQLGLDRDDVSIEVIERAKSGFLGFGSNPAKVRVSYEEENGTPKPMKDLMKEEILSVVKEEPKPVQKPAPKAEPKPEPKVETVLAAAPVVKEEAPKQEEIPAAPVEEETILCAKPGWQPKARQPRPERREQPRKARNNQIQEGDEVLIGKAERPAPKPVNLTPADPEDEKVQKITQFLTGLMEHLDVQAAPEIFVTDEGGYKVILQGQDLGAIIGRRGETLDAIQQLTNYAVNHGQSKRVRIHIDAEGYRAKREESLQRLAVKVAGKVVKYRKNMTLEAMNAYERHVIHTTLQDYPNVTTYSTGVEPNRRTVVAYAPGNK